MLRIKFPAGEYWDERKQEFIQSEGQTLLLEHSLVSLAKWESRWHKPFFGLEKKSRNETVDYIRCMTLTEDVDPTVYSSLSEHTINFVSSYINEPMTATTISDKGPKKRGAKHVITAEVIYYWMVSYGIPFEPCERWHLNRLLTLIQVCNVENQPKKKGSALDTMKQNTELNKARRKRLGTKG